MPRWSWWGTSGPSRFTPVVKSAMSSCPITTCRSHSLFFDPSSSSWEKARLECGWILGSLTSKQLNISCVSQFSCRFNFYFHNIDKNKKTSSSCLMWFLKFHIVRTCIPHTKHCLRCWVPFTHTCLRTMVETQDSRRTQFVRMTGDCKSFLDPRF